MLYKLYKRNLVFPFFFFLLFFAKNAYAENMYLYDVIYDSNKKSITLKTSKGVKAQTIKVDNPPRTVIDLESTIYDTVSKKIDINDGFIKQIRVAQFQADPPISRISIDSDEHINFDVKTTENRQGYNIVYTPIEPEKSNININNYSLKKYIKKHMNDVQALEYSGDKVVISAKSKINYQINKIDDNTYSVKLPYFTMSGITEIPVKSNQDIKDIKIKEKDNNCEFIFKMKPNTKLLAKVNESNKIEFYAQENVSLPSTSLFTNNTINSGDNFLSFDFVEKGKNSKIYISSASKGLNYKMFKLENPDRLVIDTYGTNVKDFKDILSDKYSKNLQRSRIGIIDKTDTQPEGVRIVFEMKNKVEVSDRLYNDKTLEISFKGLEDSNYEQQPKFSSQEQPRYASNIKRRFVIALDPGHGGNDPGAIGKAGYREKDVTLAVTYYLRQMLLDNGLAVLMARADDSEILLQPRVDVANNNTADLFVSVHCNSMDGDGARGVETYYRTPQSTDFAQVIHRNMIETLGAPDRGTRVRNFFVIRKTAMPSVLIEIGYLSNPSEELLLGSVAYQKKVATAIYKGIKEYLINQNKI
ncbi:MAG: N-acetylmuramoyl-L-alanine amidase [Candidatus Sericytochromatia bacterium]